MSRDKKADSGKIKLILLEGLGKAMVTDAMPPDSLASYLGTRLH